MKLKVLVGICVAVLMVNLSACGAKEPEQVQETSENSTTVSSEDNSGTSLSEPKDDNNEVLFCLEERKKAATSIGELIVEVKMGNATQYVKLYQSSDIIYLFLPGAATDIMFVNAGENGSVKISDKEMADEPVAIKFNKWLFETNDIFFNGEKGSICVMMSANIPSVFIETKVSQTELDCEKGVEYPGIMEVVMTDGTVDYSGLLDYIRTRGNTTYHSYDKKPYQIRTPKKYSALGMNKAKKWILLAGENDNTYLWNSIVCDFAREYSDVPASDGEFIDLYINGVYRGNYYLCQKVDVNTGLLKLADLEEDNEEAPKIEGVEHFGYDSTWTAKGIVDRNSPMDITGGYLLEYGPIYQADLENDSLYIMGDRVMTVKYPENATLDEVLYVKNLFAEIEEAILTPNGVNPKTGKHYSKYIDVDSFIEKFLLDCVFANADSRTSVFFYKDTDLKDGKLYAGPVWDYDKAYLWDYSVEAVDTYEESYICSILLNRKDFMQLARARYEAVYKPYIKYYLSSDIFDKVTELYPSFEMNSILWETPKLHRTKSSYIDTIMQRCADRLKTIDALVFGDEDSNMHRVVFAGGNMESTEYRMVADGDTIDNIPTGLSYDGVFIRWKRQDTGEYLYYNTPIYEDVIFEAEYLPLDILILNASEISGVDVENMVPEQFEYIADYIRKAKEKNTKE